MESIESSPPLSFHHKVSLKRLWGFFSPSKEKKEERREGKERKEKGKEEKPATFGGAGGGAQVESAIKVLFWDMFSILYEVLYPSVVAKKFKGDHFERFGMFLKVRA